MDIKALQLTSRFALPPNSLGYCGKDTAPEKFKKCITGKGCNGVSEELEKFIVLNPYLETIGEILGKHKFDYSVVEAYWLGNNELKKIKNRDYSLLMSNFLKQGVPTWFVKELRQKPPKKFIPTHLFQVLHVGVGRASGSMPYNIDTINNCMIRWGKVIKVGKTKLTIQLNSLKKLGSKYKLTTTKDSYPYRADFLPSLSTGNTVAVHWKQVVKKLTKDEVEKLTYWTKEVINSL